MPGAVADLPLVCAVAGALKSAAAIASAMKGFMVCSNN
jgi:hypothetical protein